MQSHLFELILKIKQKCMATEEVIQNELKLSQAELHGLLSISGNEQLPGSVFSERMSLSPSRGSRVLWKLVSRRLLRTSVNAADRRSVTISLTRKGKNLQQKAKQGMLTCEKKITADLTEKQISGIKESLHLLSLKL